MIRGVILDLDGTVYRGADEVPGAAECVARHRARGGRCLFVTNRANRTPEAVAAHLRGYGIDCGREDVLTSAQATALFLKHGTYYPIGEDGLVRALEEQGLTRDDRAPDYVVVSFDRGFTYDKLCTACGLIAAGARFIATNPDRALRTETGMSPGTGAIVAAVEAGSGARPLIIGKPERRIMDLALERMGLRREEAVCVGDNLDTDIRAGHHAGIRSVLILTGVTRREDIARATHAPTWVVESYAELDTLLTREA
jgi:HAD superfamily hydrolase (TIGR01457 family)